MMSLAEILDAAEALPDDDARRELAARVRHAATQLLAPEEREEKLRCADMIDALCTTSDAPRVQHTPSWKLRSVDELCDEARMEETRRMRAEKVPAISRVLLKQFPSITQANALEAAELFVAAETARADVLAGKGNNDELVQITNLAREAIQRLGADEPWRPCTQDEAFEKIGAEIRAEAERESHGPIPRGVNPDSLSAPDKAVGDRSRRTDDFGDGGFVRRGSARDGLSNIGGRASQLDHTKAGKKRRAKMLEGTGMPSEIRPAKGQRARWEAAGKQRESERERMLPEVKNARRSTDDWKKIASDDMVAALPPERPDKLLDAFTDPLKEPPLSAEEIARRKAAKARQAQREAAERRQARRDLRAKRGLPPLTAEEEAAAERWAEIDVKHEDDPEF